MPKVLTILLIFSLFSGCTKSSDENKTIRIGISLWPPYEYLYLAHEKKIFKKLGLNTKIVEFSSISDMRKAFERGQLDIIGSTLTEFVMAHEKATIDPRIFFIVDKSHGADVIISSLKIKNIKELKNKKVAVESGSMGVYLLFRALELNKITLQDVTMIPMAQEFMYNALKTNEVDAAVTYPPFLTQINSKLKLNQIFSSKEIPSEIIDVLLTSKRFMDLYQYQLVKVVNGFEEAKRLATDNNFDAWNIMASREHLSVADFKTAMSNGVVLIPYNDQEKLYFTNGELIKLISRMSNALFEMKQIDQITPHAVPVFILGKR